ncbi:hypothetical protein KSP39_PZI016252 [Platanthera zijinensis]|uniref:Uncharacterized protein n=1 Tax=Platanthera zijinensis TaxID=2320716 RepID=A0AAP0G0V1_9ASPA
MPLLLQLETTRICHSSSIHPQQVHVNLNQQWRSALCSGRLVLLVGMTLTIAGRRTVQKEKDLVESKILQMYLFGLVLFELNHVTSL